MNVEDAGRHVSIPLGRAVDAARILESVVISLDRVGSHRATGDARADTLGQFMAEWLVGPRLSRVRSVLWDAIAEVIGEAETEAIAESVARWPGPVPDEVHTLREELQGGNEAQLGNPRLVGVTDITVAPSQRALLPLSVGV